MAEPRFPDRPVRVYTALAGQGLGLLLGLAIAPGGARAPLLLLAAICCGRYAAMSLYARTLGSRGRAAARQASVLWLLGFALTALASAAVARRSPASLVGIVPTLLGGPVALWLATFFAGLRSILGSAEGARAPLAPEAGSAGEGRGS